MAGKGQDGRKKGAGGGLDPGLDDLLARVADLVDEDLPATGATPAAVASARFYPPHQPQQALDLEHLARQAAALGALFDKEQLDDGALAGLTAISVYPGERCGRALGAGAPSAGPHLRLTEQGYYEAERYGYLTVDSGRPAVRSPLWLDPNALTLSWVVLDPRPVPLLPELFLPWIEELRLDPAVILPRVKEVLVQSRGTAPPVGVHLLASGRPAMDGTDGRVEMAVDLGRRAGRELADGSLDFREVNFVTAVQAGQLLARRLPPTAGTAGVDLRGQTLPARPGRPASPCAGPGVTVESGDGEERFVALRDGALRRDGDRLAVVEVLVLDGGVDTRTGNIDFPGDVVVNGPIRQGFRVRAGGDLTVTGAVEEGTRVKAGGDLTIGLGVVGEDTVVEAGGTVRLQYVHHATVSAGGDIVVGNYVFNGFLRASGAIDIRRATGERSGSCAGGRLWAATTIDLHQAGSTAWTATELAAGRDMNLVAAYDRVEEGIRRANGQLWRLLRTFGLDRLDPAAIRAAVARATGDERRRLQENAARLAEVGKAYQKLLVYRQQLKEGMAAVDPDRSRIRIRGRAYPGVVLRIGTVQLRLEEEQEAVCFRLREGELVAAPV